MTTREKSKRFVVDVSVARSAGDGQAESVRCREILESIRDYPHLVATCADFWNEWDRQEMKSAFAVRWFGIMVSRKLHVLIEQEECENVRAAIASVGWKASEQETMLKDIYLLESALLTDKLVVSKDHTARSLFTLLAEHEAVLQDVRWISPLDADDPCDWIRRGAQFERWKTIGKAAK